MSVEKRTINYQLMKVINHFNLLKIQKRGLESGKNKVPLNGLVPYTLKVFVT